MAVRFSSKILRLVLLLAAAAVFAGLPDGARQVSDARAGAEMLRSCCKSIRRAAGMAPDARVQAMLDQVSGGTLYGLVAGLSGEQPIIVGGASYTLTTRYTGAAAAINRVTQYAYEYFQSLGLDVTYHYWSYSSLQRRNVAAEQPGRRTDCIYLLTAHLDSTSSSPSTNAPGADDNASGSAGVLAAASVLSAYRFECTLRYVLFTGEEQGMLGSAVYAQSVAGLGEPVSGVLNLDMLGYNTPNSAPTIEMDIRSGAPGAPDRVLTSMFSAVIEAYQINLAPRLLPSDETGSDHSSFWDEGYPAVLLIEDWQDHTPYYHTPGDRVSSLNMPYYTDFVKAVVGAMAHLAEISPPRRVFLPVLRR